MIKNGGPVLFGMEPLELGNPLQHWFSFLSFLFFLLLILNLSDPSLSARYSADVKTDVPVVLFVFVFVFFVFFVTDWICMTLEMSPDSVSSPETKLLDRKGEHAGRGIPTYFAYTSLIMIDSRQMGLMTCAHWADISGILWYLNTGKISSWLSRLEVLSTAIDFYSFGCCNFTETNLYVVTEGIL